MNYTLEKHICGKDNNKYLSHNYLSGNYFHLTILSE